jgi:hypothetical protein
MIGIAVVNAVVVTSLQHLMWFTARPSWMMRLKKLLFLCFVPVFLALAFIGVPPPFLQAPRPQQQEQGDGLKKGE